MASANGARWIAASVETTRTRSLSAAQRETLMNNMRLAEQLGAETVTLTGDDIADEIVSYARSQNVTRIVIGKSRQPRWRSLISPNIVDSLLRESGGIDIYVIQGLGEAEGGQAPPAPVRPPRRWRPYPAAIGLVVIAWAVAFLLHRAGLSETNQAVVFIPAVIGAALWWGLWPGVVAAVASVLAFDFFFVPPYYTFAVRDAQYLITLLVMLGVALLVGTLAARLRRQVHTSRQREERLEILNRLSRTLAGISGTHQLAVAAQQQVAAIFSRPARIYLPDGPLLGPVVSTTGEEAASPHQMAVATWAFEHGRVAGNATDTLPDSPALYLPLIAAERTVGVLAVELPAAHYPLAPETRRLLETVASQIALALARDGSGGAS
jgi:two-component system sensor histidine kinase KdpD